MLVRPNSILSTVKTEENTIGIFRKAPIRPSDSEKQDYLVWWTSILSIMFEWIQLCSSHVECVGGGGGTQSRAFRTSDWAENSPSNRTMNLNTQQERLIDNSVNVFEWPRQSLGLNPIEYFWRNLKMCICPHPTWKSLRDEEVRRRMADNCQMLRSKACRIKQKRLEAI